MAKGKLFVAEAGNCFGMYVSPVIDWVFRTDDFSRLLAAVPEDVTRSWLDRVGVRGPGHSPATFRPRP